MSNITLLHYNNYYNRIVKKESSLASYKLLDANYHDVNNINFNPNDGITTDIVVGKGNEQAIQDFDLSSFDYLVVSEIDSNNVVSITSRWFIMEATRTRGGQYKLQLKRDVLVDFEAEIEESPVFVEKGIINDETSPLLFNNENVNVNQIKIEEMLLRDNTFCP